RTLRRRLRPSPHVRSHERLLSEYVPATSSIAEIGAADFELPDGRDTYPSLRLSLLGAGVRVQRDVRTYTHILYRIEKSRGYEYEGGLWSPGVIHIDLRRGEDEGLIASVESWPVVKALSFADAQRAETERRARLLSIAGAAAGDDFFGQLVLAADQFLIRPHSRPSDVARV